MKQKRADNYVHVYNMDLQGISEHTLLSEVDC